MSLYDDYKPSRLGNAKRYFDSVDRRLLRDIEKKKHPEKDHVTLDKFLKKTQ